MSTKIAKFMNIQLKAATQYGVYKRLLSSSSKVLAVPPATRTAEGQEDLKKQQ